MSQEKTYANANNSSDNISDMEICARIVQIRVEISGPRGKAAFARKLGLSPTTYQRYEGGRVPPAGVLVKIADIAGVDLRWLLTGRSGPGAAVLADHPAVQRAAALLDRCPDAAAPLAAFVDILRQSMAFPQTPAPGAAAGGAEAEADRPAHAGEHPDDCSSWIPILGRSAAGVPHFWDQDDDAAGVTTLGELISRHASDRRDVRPAEARGDDPAEHRPVQLIALTGRESGEVVQFVAAVGIKARHADAFAVRIDGESMSPDIRHGDVVILSPSTGARDGHPAVVQLKRQIGVTCKLFRREGRTVHLVPINEQFRPQTFAATDLEWALGVLARVRET